MKANEHSAPETSEELQRRNVSFIVFFCFLFFFHRDATMLRHLTASHLTSYSFFYQLALSVLLTDNHLDPSLDLSLSLPHPSLPFRRKKSAESFGSSSPA